MPLYGVLGCLGFCSGAVYAYFFIVFGFVLFLWCMVLADALCTAGAGAVAVGVVCGTTVSAAKATENKLRVAATIRVNTVFMIRSSVFYSYTGPVGSL